MFAPTSTSSSRMAWSPTRQDGGFDEISDCRFQIADWNARSPFWQTSILQSSTLRSSIPQSAILPCAISNLKSEICNLKSAICNLEIPMNVIDFININRERYLDELKALLAIPSISALPQHAGDVRRCAEWCADEMRRIGLQNVRLIDTPGNPVTYGDWLGAEGAPTILFYGHYDVQPVDPPELWEP